MSLLFSSCLSDSPFSSLGVALDLQLDIPNFKHFEDVLFLIHFNFSLLLLKLNSKEVGYFAEIFHAKLGLHCVFKSDEVILSAGCDYQIIYPDDYYNCVIFTLLSIHTVIRLISLKTILFQVVI